MNAFESFLVGASSDLWTTAILCVVLILLNLAAPLKVSLYLTMVYLVVLGGFYAMHQPYVEFFHFPFIPIHLEYLYDLSFIQSNSRSFINWKSMVTVMLLCFGLWGAHRQFFIDSVKYPKFVIITVVSCLAVALGLHAFQIKYKVQWHIPEGLKYNLFEGLYVQLTTNRSPTELTELDWASLRNQLPRDTEDRDENALANILLGNERKVFGFEQEIKNLFQDKVKNNKKPVALALLLESLRPSEISAYADGEPGIMTESLDDFAKTGIWFTQAFSTGLVTRSGQESVLCGYQSGQTTAMMRNRLNVNFPCLTERLSDTAHTFWYHNGEGRFDSQEAFWKSRDVDELISQKNFAADVAKSDWGKSDCALYDKVLDRLYNYKNNINEPYALGMVLTVTNHIPWKLPSDAKLFDIKKRAKHPSHVSSLYSEKCFGRFIDTLKKEGFWDDLLIVAVSDHGVLLPQAHKVIHERNSPEDQLSHVYLALNGGIVQRAIEKSRQSSVRYDHVVSQVDVATSLGSILDVREFRSFGDSLFDVESRKPVLVELSNDLYMPEKRQKISLNLLLGSDVPDQVQFEASYYKSFLYLIDRWDRLKSF